MNNSLKLGIIAFVLVIFLLGAIYLMNAKEQQSTTTQKNKILNQTNNKKISKNNLNNTDIVSNNGNINTNVIYQIIISLPKQDIDETEKEGLLEMREEEKLARDVYLTLYNKWHIQIFKNIAGSEQTHMDSIKYLLEKYNITDPVTNDSIGEFSNPKFKELYNKLVEQGSKSPVDALIVGATIEDLDIADLEKWINKTDNEDIRFVYENLMKGSRNHMRAFTNWLKMYNKSYTPKYISKEEFEQIINSDMERGMGGGRWR